MRLVFPSATIAIISASSCKAVAVAGDGRNHDVELLKSSQKEETGHVDVEQQHPHFEQSSDALSSSPAPVIGKECKVPSSSSKEEYDADLGVLALPLPSAARRCHPRRQVCIPDESSLLGGRCRDKTSRSTSRRRRLQEEPFECPADTCPEELCACASATELGFPDPQDCATELQSVCTSKDGLKDCFKKDYWAFYEQTYCPFADCWLDGNGYEDCACGYYQNYCTLYGEYAGDYPEVADKCETAACCDEAVNSDEKSACLPALMPSSKPSLSPTATLVPSPVPTTAGPTSSPSEKNSSPPSSSPTQGPTDSPTNSGNWVADWNANNSNGSIDVNVSTGPPMGAPVAPPSGSPKDEPSPSDDVTTLSKTNSPTNWGADWNANNSNISNDVVSTRPPPTYAPVAPSSGSPTDEPSSPDDDVTTLSKSSRDDLVVSSSAGTIPVPSEEATEEEDGSNNIEAVTQSPDSLTSASAPNKAPPKNGIIYVGVLGFISIGMGVFAIV